MGKTLPKTFGRVSAEFGGVSSQFEIAYSRRKEKRGAVSLLLTHAEDDVTAPWLEDHLQMAVARELLRLEDGHNGRFTFAADMSGMAAANKRVAGRAKLMGMRSGETDLRLYFSGPRILQIEMKTVSGVVSGEQKKRHALLRSMGFRVEVVRATCPTDAVKQVTALVESYLTAPA